MKKINLLIDFENFQQRDPLKNIFKDIRNILIHWFLFFVSKYSHLGNDILGHVALEQVHVWNIVLGLSKWGNIDWKLLWDFIAGSHINSSTSSSNKINMVVSINLLYLLPHHVVAEWLPAVRKCLSSKTIEDFSWFNWKAQKSLRYVEGRESSHHYLKDNNSFIINSLLELINITHY